MVVLASIGVLSFENALFLALGSNIGTCITSIMSSAGTSVNAKRTAVVHLLFNTFGCVLFIVPIWIFSTDITTLFESISSDVGQQIAIFHTLFNVITTIILLPFANMIVKLVCKIIPEKKHEEDNIYKFSYIDNRMLQTPPIAVGNIRREVVKMGEMAKANIVSAVDMLLDGNLDNESDIREKEDKLNWLNKNITAYLIKLMSKDLSEIDDKKVGSYYHVVSDIERVGDYAENIMEYALKLREEGMSFSEEAVVELRKMTNAVCELFDFSFTAFDERDVFMLDKVNKLEEQLDDMTTELESKHIERVKKGACTAQLGSVYLQTVSNLERVGDHINNVAVSIRKYSHA
jgi:phosphate:Na+ symporter